MSDSNGLVGSQLDAGSHVSAEASAKKDCDHANSDCSETNECSPDSPCYPLPFECDMTDDAAIAELLTMDMLDEDCSAQGAMQASVAAGNGAEPVQLVDAPDVVASADHTVMFRLPVVIGGAGGAGACPRPHGSDRGRDAWDAEHVRMPCSPHSLYPLSSGGGGGGGRGGGSDRDYIEHDRAGDNPTTVTGRGGDGGIIRGGNSGGGYVSTGRGGGGGGNEVEPGGGGPRLVSRWRLICQSLRQPFTASGDLERAVFAYNSRMRGRWNFDGWRHFVDEYLDEDESRHLLHRTLPALARLALCLPQLVCKPLPLLRRHCNRSVSLSQQQVACLLANAFFCTYPRRNAGFVTRRRLAASTTAAAAAVYPNINMSGLFAGGSGLGRRCEKLRCLLHYFHQVLKQVPCGTVTYTRHWVPAAAAPDWARLPRRPLTRLRPSDTGVLEQQPAGQLHVDFANCLVGGGVLANGCVQEEIAFVQRPELVVACLLSERLAPGEALLVTGAQLFNATEGYRDTLQWRAPVRDSQPRDRYGRRMWRMVAIDAADYSHCSLTQWSLRSQTSSLSSTAAESSSRRHVQYRPDQIDRELLKAYAGFSVRANWLRHPRSQSAAVGLLPPVATGNWGCGAFGGDRRLKAVIQWLAASAAGRDTVYLTFGDRALCDQLVRLDRVAAAAATAATAAAASLCAGVDTAAAGGAAAATAGGGVVGVAFVYSLLLKYGAQMCSSSDRAGGAADCDVLEYMIAQMAAQTHSGNAAHGKPAHVASSVGESTASRQSSAATGVCSDSDSSPPVDSREQGTNGVTMTFDCEENVNTGSSCRGAKATSPVMTESSGNDTCTHGLSTMSIDGAVVSAANSTHNSGSPPTCRSTAEQKTTSIAKSANHSSNTERLHISESDDSDSQMSERLSLPKRMKSQDIRSYFQRSK